MLLDKALNLSRQAGNEAQGSAREKKKKTRELPFCSGWYFGAQRVSVQSRELAGSYKLGKDQ